MTVNVWGTSVLAAVAAISEHTKRGDLDDGLIFDAVRVRLIEIGEAVGALGPELLEYEPDVPWADVRGMRNHLAHRYFDTAHSVVRATLVNDLLPLLAAVERLLRRVASE
ncbi:DUF86 domain-containing protein [Pseudonocardia eucalypti]|uniref:DUF86 domain-containing protein n=1 Tax=Pseudonocardia eucalypti TaxID=648755 RepID=A0ABP9PUL1_9PSEU|nr:uncharacterized protein with HEPN domain [Pseudonocardia eucalypti]